MQKKGISLIVLVITIIVMIILAASVVISLNNTGIINKANTATQTTNEKQIQQLADVAWAEAYAEGIRDKEKIKEYIENKFEENNIDLGKYQVVVTDKGVIFEEGYDIEVVIFEGKEYNGKLVAEGGKFNNAVNSFAVEGNALKINLGEEVLEFGIIKGVYPFDIIDGSSMGLGFGGVFDSNNDVIITKEGRLEYGRYTLVFVSDESQLANLQTGDYYLAHTYWETGWFDEPYLSYSEFAEITGYKFEECWYQIKKDDEVLKSAFILDNNFGEVKSLVEKIRNDNGGEYKGYTVYNNIGMIRNNKIVLEESGSEWKGVLPFNTIYDVVDGTKIPNSVRDKETKEYGRDFYEKLEEAKKVHDDGTAVLEVTSKYEYFAELKLAEFEYGIKFNVGI